MAVTPRRRRRIVIGVTVDLSIPLLGEIPQRLADKGWDVHIVSGDGPRLERLASQDGISTHVIPMRRDPAPLHDVIALLRWVLLLARIRPSVLWVGTPKASFLSMVAGALTRVPVRSYLIRGLRMETVSGWRRRLLGLLESVTIRCSTDIVAISSSLAVRLTELGLAPAERIKVLGRGSSHGVDLSRFDGQRHSASAARAHLGLDPDEFVVGFAGRVCTDKGAAELAEAVARIPGPSKPRLVLIGSVEDEALLDSIKRLNPSAIHVDHSETIESLYPAFSVLCLPSHREGFGNVVIEAAAMGVPSVVTDATGVRDSVEDGRSGLIVPRGDIAALTTALARFRTASWRDSLGEAAQRFARDNFASSQVEKRYVEHLDQWESGPIHRVVASLEGRVSREEDGSWTCRAPHAHRNYWEPVLKEGVAVTLIAREVEPPLTNAPLVTPQIGICALPGTPVTRMSLASVPRASFRLLKLLRRSSCVYVRMPGVVGPLVALGAFITRKRLIVHLVGYPIDAAPVFDSVWKTQLGQTFFHLGTLLATRHADVVLYVDPELSDRYASSDQRNSDPARTLRKRNVDLEAITWSDRPRLGTTGPLTLVAAGSQERDYKGHDLLITACAELLKSGTQLKLRLIGDGRLRPFLVELAETHGILDHVEFVGHLPGTEAVQAQISRCDLFVQPSRTEGFPRALVEAMATGIPCVATDVGAVADILPAHLLIPAPTIDDVRETIAALINDSDRMSAAAQECLDAALEFRVQQQLETERFAQVLTATNLRT